jgi:hypothetical protein
MKTRSKANRELRVIGDESEDAKPTQEKQDDII